MPTYAAAVWSHRKANESGASITELITKNSRLGRQLDGWQRSPVRGKTGQVRHAVRGKRDGQPILQDGGGHDRRRSGMARIGVTSRERMR